MDRPVRSGGELKDWMPGQPRIERSITLQFIGDWGQANFHRICSWLCQEFCDRAGPRSRVAIWNTVEGGIDAAVLVSDGEADLAILTPSHALPSAIIGKGPFAGRPMESLRALAVLPQRDAMLFALPEELGIRTFAELRARRPALTIATSEDNGFNLIGYTARRFLEAHGIDEANLTAWGGKYVCSARPDLSLARFRDGEADAVLQEAVMTPWWREALARRRAVILPAEAEALALLARDEGWRSTILPRGYFAGQEEAVPTLDFSDFVLIVRDDLPDDVAHLLTWCLVERRRTLESQYHHLPPERSPLTYPLDPAAMAMAPLPLHPGARRYFREAGHLDP